LVKSNVLFLHESVFAYTSINGRELL